ncbi:MAG: acylphosphatase [Methanomicrobiaceae archaeon]|nr:acylphosphatase [Methanomicrobiaceae archaeon]
MAHTSSRDDRQKEPRTIRVIISGRVQKVGFRACIRHFATSIGITGEVMNLEDGRVLIHATAEPVILEKFMSMLYSCPRAIIRDMHVNTCEFRAFPDFSIERGVHQYVM